MCAILDEMDDLIKDCVPSYPLEPTPIKAESAAEATPVTPPVIPMSSPSSILMDAFDGDAMDFFIKQIKTSTPNTTSSIQAVTPTCTLLEDDGEMDIMKEDILDDILPVTGDIFDETQMTDEVSTVVSEEESSTAASPKTTPLSTNAVPSSFYRPEQWDERYQELIDFKKAHGHCLVPHNWEVNQPLSRWVKRQRYQYKLKYEQAAGIKRDVYTKRSALTPAREQALDEIGFVWSTHNAIWEEKFYELAEFSQLTGHCNVPSKYPTNPKLSVWVRCQRRQYKLFLQISKQQVAKGTRSSMTPERISKLQSLGFDFNPRKLKL